MSKRIKQNLSTEIWFFLFIRFPFENEIVSCFKVFFFESEVQKIIYTNYADKNNFTDLKHEYSESLYFFHDIFPIIGYTYGYTLFKSHTYYIENVSKFRQI